MFSSGKIRFMMAMVVSGSVMLLVLGRQKLWESKFSQNSSVKRRKKDVDYRPCCRRSGLADAAANSSAAGGLILPGKRTNAKKKVRFAEDVVEPSGDNEKYRRRHTSAMIRRLRQRTFEAEENTDDCSSNPRQPARTVNSTRESIGTDAVNAYRGISGVRRTLAKPNFPANRLALYKGILQYRSQRAASVY